MKGLSQFQHFDCAGFLTGKVLSTLACGQLIDYTTKQVIGTKVTVVVIEDKTAYRAKAGEQISNLYEKMNIKVPGKTLDFSPGTQVELVNPSGVIFGDYRNQLSIRAEDVKVIQPAKA